MTCVALVHQGLRLYQEDRHHIVYNLIDNFDYFAVFDGHGSDEVSEFLRVNMHNFLKTELKQDQSQPVEFCILNALRRITDTIPRNIATNSGSTAVIAIKHKDVLYVANIGDSRAIVNANDDVGFSTKDHKPDLDEESRRIYAMGGSVILDAMGTPRVNGTLALSRAIGDMYLAPCVTWHPDISRLKIEKQNKYMIIASDGLWDVIQNDEVVKFVNSRLQAQNTNSSHQKSAYDQVTHQLLNLALARGASDNITILLIIF